MIIKLKKTFLQIGSIIHPNFTQGFFYVTFLGLLMAFLDLVGISFMFYVISLVLGISEGGKIPIISQYLTDNHFILLTAVSALFVLYLLKNIFVILCNKVQLKFAFEVGAKVSQQRYHQLIKREATYFSSEKSTDIMNQIIGAGVLIPENIIIPFVIWVSEVLLILLIGIALAAYNIKLFLFLFIIFFPAILIIFYVNQIKIKKLGRNIHQQMPFIYDNLLQLNRGIDVIKLWHSESHFGDLFRKTRDTLYRNKKELQLRMYFIPIRVFEMVALFGIFALVIYSYLMNTTSEIANIMAVYAAVAFRILPSINRIVGSTNQIISHQYVFEHFNDFSFKENEEYKGYGSLKYKNKILLKNIHFQYEPQKKCITNLSLEINRGGIIGVQGKNGEGKTTLLKIICGIINPKEGNIQVDDTVITSENKHSYHLLFSYVSQEAFLVLGSVRDNLQFYKTNQNQAHEDLKMIEILRKVGLMDWFESLPDGLNSKIGEWGKTLSGGQKQKLAIARSIYKDTQVFICDEITNGLDAQSVKQLLALLQDLSQSGKTIILSSHIASDLNICTKKFELSNGTFK
jgi:ABC-type multidrug transport system fused ATPase/permease subunit